LTIGGGSAIAVTNTVTVTGNSTILLQSVNTSAQVSGQWLGQGVTISATNLQVDAGSTISANGQGYSGNNCSGPGAGPGGGPLNCNNNGNGGSYGGQGGGPNPGTTYGSALAPTDLGSGGSGGYGLYQGSGQGLGGAGGGSIRLVVSGTLTDNGTISANGSNATQNGGGGSGGSIYVTTGTLSGSGIFTANGGVVAATATGGGGGRIAVYYANYGNYGGFQTSTANGSSGGGPGSAFFANTTTNDLLVSGGQTLALSTSSAVTYDNIAVQDGANLVVIDGGSTLNVNGTFTVTGNSTVLLESQNNTAQVGGQWQGQGVTINAANLQVDAGSTISAAGQGYAGNTCAGPGAGPGGGPLNCNNNGNGGSYGGLGAGPNPGTTTYGSAFAPTDLGSGGSGAYGIGAPGGAGGGAIRLVVSGTLTDNGTITANGATAPSNTGGGSGGSIYVTTGTITGSGIFTANGGATGATTGGGGGRIAIDYATNSSFNPAVSMTANAGSTTGGQPGSLVFVNSTNNDLLIPGGRLETSQNTTLSFNNITIENSASVIMDGGSTLNAAATLTVTGTSSLVVGSKNNTVQISGQWQGAGGTINAANVQVDSGSVISADGQGYVGNTCAGPGAGPGGGPLNCNNNGNGGSYGGQGGGPNPGTTYGSALAPTALGSGGSGAYGIGAPGGAGGGAISLVVSGTLTDNGTITANGAGAQVNAGGGSGGSIYVSTGTIAGTGIITANGGATGSNTGGGGGRVAIYYNTCSSSLNPANVTAKGGATGGGAGTVIFAIAPTITWTTPAAITYGTALSATQLNATASVPCSSTGVAGTYVYNPVAGTVLTVGTQKLSVTFTPTDTTDYTSATASVSLTVNQVTQTITFTAPTSPVTYGVSPITLVATGGASGNAVIFSVVSGPATVSGSTLTITGAGTVVVAANQAGNTNYSAATQVTHSIVVNQVTQTITFTAPTSPVTYGVSPITLVATGGASGNAVIFSVISGPGTVSGSTLTITGAGTVVVAANQAGNTNYSAATAATQNIVVNQATQTITFTAPTSPVTYGVSPISLVATGGASGNAVVFSVVSGPGTVSGSTLTITGAGTVVVAANQAGNTNYAAATQVTQSIVVNQASQTITFTAPTSPVTYGVSPITLSASSTSGLAVTFSVVSGPGTVSGTNGSTLTITGVGTVVVAANQAGNTNYTAATAATQSIVVNVIGVAATPTFSPVAGTYTAAQTVTISDATAGATIYYTTNGTTPTTSSSVYSGAITVSSTETLQAIATATGYSSSAVASAAYTLVNPAPAISGVSPAFTNAGGAAFTLTVNGSGFIASSTVYWGASALITTYVNATQLTAQVPATDIATGGISVAITVTTPSPGGGASNSFQFEVDSAAGTTTGLQFSSVTQTVTAGSTASYPVTVPSAVTSVSVTCLNLPTGATCSYNTTTNSVTIATSSTTPKGTYQVTVVFTETVTSAGFLIPILLLPLGFLRRKSAARGIWLTACLGLVLLATAALSIGCGGGSSTPPPTQQATSSGSVSLTVQ
jgi:hypothetical protein